MAQRLSGPIHIAAEIPQSAAELTRQRAIFALEVTEAESIGQLVDSLAVRAGAEVSETAGRWMYRYRFDISEIPDLPPLELAVPVMSDTMMLSRSADFLEATLTDRGSRRPLADSPRYQKIAAQVPEQTWMISYQRQDARIGTAGWWAAGFAPGLPKSATSTELWVNPSLPATFFNRTRT